MKGYNEEAKESMQFVYKGNIEDEFDRMAETIGSLCCRNDATVDDGVDVDDDMSNTSFFSKVDKDGDLAIPSASGSNNNNYNSEYSSAQKSPTIVETVDTTKLSFWSPQYRKVMMIGITLLIAQQFSGQPSVLAYSRVLFEAAGWQGHASVVTVVIMGITSIGTVALVDRVGRKILLAAGCAIMALALGALTYGFWGWDDDDKNDLSTFKKHLILASMFVYIAGYQVGYGPITWTLLSEIYPSEIRGTAMALSVEINFLSKFLCQLFFPIIQDVLGWGCTFIMFGCIVVISFFFILLKVPETMGKSLEEIQIQLCVTEDNKNNEKVKPMHYSEQNASTSTSTSSKQQLSSPLLDQRVAAGLTPIV
jgi:Na+/melibiose symporter-like transporter